MPEVLKNLLYGLGFILILTRFAAGLDIGIFKVPDYPKKKSMKAMFIGVLIILSLIVFEHLPILEGEKNSGSTVTNTPDKKTMIRARKGETSLGRFTPDKKTKITLPDGEILEGFMEARVYSQHDYVYLRFSDIARLQLYKFRPKSIGSNEQGCLIELIAYSEVPPTADIKLKCN